MKIIFSRPINLFLLFGLLNFSVFSQDNKQNVYLQISSGNTFYFNPVTYTRSFSPALEVLLIKGKDKVDAKTQTYLQVGLGYNHNVQEFAVVWPGTAPTKPVLDNFNTNEFLFNLGGIFRCAITEKWNLNVYFGLQMGHNHTWTNDQNAIITMYRAKSTGTPFSWDHPSEPFDSSGSNIIIARRVPYKWEYLQFYIGTGVQFQYQATQQVSILFGFKPRFSFYTNYITEEIEPGTKLNCASVKLTMQASVQFKLFR